MVDILETLQEKYVPMVENGGERVPADIVFFGGDQLTDERARNIQKARMDGDTIQETRGTVAKKRGLAWN